MNKSEKTNRFLAENSKNSYSRLMNKAAVFLIVLLAVGTSFSQQAERGFQSANTYAATGLEIANTTNGNLMMNFPIASLPAGRGGSPGYTVTLQYNSKLWDGHQVNHADGSPDEYGQTGYTTNSLALSPRGGWQLYSQYSLEITNRLSFESPSVCRLNNPDPVEHLAFRWKLEMAIPDGSVRQFYPETGRNYQVGMGDDGYANIDTNGGVYTAIKGQHPGTGICYTDEQYQQATTSGMTYITMDGSRMRLFIPYQPSLMINQRNWKLYMPDGTVVENSPPDNTEVAQRKTDRNGNFVEHIGNKIIDQMGRSIEFTSDSNPGGIIRVRGVGNEPVDIRLIWQNRWVNKIYRKSQNANAPEYQKYGNLFAGVYGIERIVYPTQLGNQSMEFEYDSLEAQPNSNDYTDGWGEMTKVILPTGAISEYQFLDEGQGNEVTASEIVDRYVSTKDLNYNEQYDGAAPVQKTDLWDYTISPLLNGITSPNGAVNLEYLHNYTPSFPSWDNGMAYKSVNPDGSMTERLWAYNLPYTIPGTVPDVPGSFAGVGNANAYVKAEFTTLANASGQPALTAIKDFKYDKNGNVIEVREYDWVAWNAVPRTGSGSFSKVTGLPTSGLTLKRKTINTYYNQASDADSQSANSNSYSDPSSPKLKNVIKSTEIQDAGGTPVARSEFLYDDPDNKGNVIETRSWDTTKQATLGAPDGNGFKQNTGNSINSTAVYDSYGNPTNTTDAKGVSTEITYGAINGQSGLYPTMIKTALGLAEQRTVTSEYDFYTGLVTSATDEDNNVTNVTEYDALGRPIESIAAAGTALAVSTTTEYNDLLRRVVVRSDLETLGDGKKVAIQHYDELGRVRLSRSIENIATEDPYDEEDGIKVQTRYLMADPFSYQLTSNPYRAATSSAATNEPSMGWTRSKAENTGRKSEIETFSGAGLPMPWGSNSVSSGKVLTELDAERTLVTDQAGKKRISKTNALGQLTDVWEIKASDSDTEAVSIGNPVQNLNGYKTSYQYDTLNNLKQVNQGVQTRTFSYSSLSRLLTANNPESGTIAYVYDNNGNLTKKTDARQVETSYIYDNINRVTQRSYANEPSGQSLTPTVYYTYDNLSGRKGQLTKVQNSYSTTEYTAFDILNRVTKSKQTTDGTAYNEMEYTYNLSGALTETKYPSGRIVKNELDSDGRLANVTSKRAAESVFRQFANNFKYTAAGAVESMQYGNGRFETMKFNSRLQPTQIGLGHSTTNQGLLKLDYDYGTTDNNGNVKSQTITVPTVGQYNGFNAVQNYTYDELNRLKSADENLTPTGGSATETWKQTYTFDRYGNRRFEEANTTTLPKNCGTPPNLTVCPAEVPIVNPTIDPETNKLTGYTFDTAGNTKVDAEGRTFVYDGENKQIEVKDASSNIIGQYFYDGDGKRVKKLVPLTGETTIFHYDAGGKLIAEYSTVVEPVSSAQTSYLTNDHLGSPRAITNQFGAVTSRRDFQPFGEEIYSSGRTGVLGYSGDSVRQKFTGYERDTETELDFAQARYFNYGHGRFSSPDSFVNDTHASDPSSWNLFVYARNNPMNLIDPTGEKADVNVTYNEETKTYVFTVTASFGVYVANGNLSQKQINKQIKHLENQIEKAYGREFSNSKTGASFKVTVDITVKQYSSERKAEAAGKSGEVDNIVGLVNAKTIGGGEPGKSESPNATGRGYRVEGEDFDRMLVATKSANANSTYAHEFGHLLSASGHQNETLGLMNTTAWQTEYSNKLQVADFNHVFQKYKEKNDSSKAYLYSGRKRERFWYGTVRAAMVYKSKSTIRPGR